MKNKPKYVPHPEGCTFELMSPLALPSYDAQDCYSEVFEAFGKAIKETKIRPFRDDYMVNFRKRVGGTCSTPAGVMAVGQMVNLALVSLEVIAKEGHEGFGRRLLSSAELRSTACGWHEYMTRGSAYWNPIETIQYFLSCGRIPIHKTYRYNIQEAPILPTDPEFAEMIRRNYPGTQEEMMLIDPIEYEGYLPCFLSQRTACTSRLFANATLGEGEVFTVELDILSGGSYKFHVHGPRTGRINMCEDLQTTQWNLMRGWALDVMGESLPGADSFACNRVNPNKAEHIRITKIPNLRIEVEVPDTNALIIAKDKEINDLKMAAAPPKKVVKTSKKTTKKKTTKTKK